MSLKNDKLRDLSSEEIQSQINDAREELMRFRFQQSTGELTDFTQIRQTRRQIARLLTILGEREETAMMEGEA